MVLKSSVSESFLINLGEGEGNQIDIGRIPLVLIPRQFLAHFIFKPSADSGCLMNSALLILEQNSSPAVRGSGLKE